MGDGLVPAEDIQLNRLSVTSPRVIARRHDDVARPGGRKGPRTAGSSALSKMISHLPAAPRRRCSRATSAASVASIAGLKPEPGSQVREGQVDRLWLFRGNPPDEVVVGLNRCAYSSAAWVLPTPPMSVQGPRRTTALPSADRSSCSLLETAARPVKSAFLLGTFHVRGTPPRSRVPGAPMPAGAAHLPRERRQGGLRPGQRAVTAFRRPVRSVHGIPLAPVRR